MSCLEIARIMQSYVDEEMDELTARRVAWHLEICRECGLEVETYIEIKKAISRRHGSIPTDTLLRLEEFARNLTEEPPPATTDVTASGT